MTGASFGRAWARRLSLPLVATFVAVLALPTEARANGLTTHTWITRRALELLPEGELKTLLSKPERLDDLVSGTIFPDGGYAAGDGYGELAHWEPFQVGYLEWIRAHYSAPWSEEAQRHLAFYFGLASHGMADQVFDSLYMERAKQNDAASDWTKSMDEATDVAFAALTGPQPVPKRWVPTEVFTEIFARTGPHDVDGDTMLQGQNLAGLAVAVVGMLGQDRQAVADYARQFPWATGHMADGTVPGRPEVEAEVIAEYWQRQWARINGVAEPERLVLATIPADGALGHERSAKQVESRLTIAFARRLSRVDLTEDHFHLFDSAGRAHPFSLDLFYGNDSHVVHVVPKEDLAADETYTVVVDAGLRFTEGFVSAAAWSFSVSTKTPVAATTADGCTCVASDREPGALPLALLALALLTRRRRPHRPSWRLAVRLHERFGR